jgi:hypothetical protein
LIYKDVILFWSFQIAFLKAALAKKEGEPENILSTQSSPSIYRIRKGNATPAAPKDRQPMEEVGNLEVIFPVYFSSFFLKLFLFLFKKIGLHVLVT